MDNPIQKTVTGIMTGIWPEITKFLKNRFLSYPTQPWTLPKGLERVFQFKDAGKPPKTGAKPSVQTHQELEQNPVLNKVKSQALIPLVGPFCRMTNLKPCYTNPLASAESKLASKPGWDK